MPNAELLVKDPVLNSFKQRITQIYGGNVYSAYLVGARARGVVCNTAPYDIVLFLNQMRDKLTECEHTDCIQDELLQTFDAEFNIFPFSSADFDRKDGMMRAVRSV